VGQYDNMLKDQLRELCLSRNLNVSGTNAELVARLEGADAAKAQQDGQEPDLLAEAGLDDEVQEQAVAPVAYVEPDPHREEEPEVLPVNRTVHRVRYECPRGVIPTEMHEQFLRSTENAAIRAGHVIRGHAHRVSYQDEGDKHYAVYEVSLGRNRQEVR